MSKTSRYPIKKVSKLVQMLILLFALVHIGSFFLTLIFSQDNSTTHQIEGKQAGIQYTAFTSVTRDDHALAQALLAEDYHVTAILGSPYVAIYAMLYSIMFRLFGLYRRGQIFTHANINCFKQIGFCLLIWVLSSLIYPIVVALTIRLFDPSSTMALHFSFGTTELEHLLLGMIIYVIGWVIGEAMALQDEQKLVI